MRDDLPPEPCESVHDATMPNLVPPSGPATGQTCLLPMTGATVVLDAPYTLPPSQRFQRGHTRLAACAALVVAIGVAVCVALGTVLLPLLRVPPGVAFAIGSASDFAPESVALRELPAALEQFHPQAGMFAVPAGGLQPGKPPWPARPRVTPVPVYLAVDAQGTLRAFYQYDPWSSCAVPWQQAERKFIDPCWGSSYTLSGECVRGPCQRGLDRFAIERRLDGTLVVRIDTFELGPTRTHTER